MNLVPWKNKSGESPEGRSALVEFRSEVNRLFDSFFREPIGALGDSLSDTVSAWGRWSPTIDVSENDSSIMVRAELPGLDANDLDITVTGDRLTIAGEKKESVEKNDQDLHHREIRYGSFSRTLNLPSAVDQQAVTADYTQGVLTITLKKTPGATARKIQVKSSSSTAP